MNAHDDGYLSEALTRLRVAINERVGGTVMISKADACAIGAALAAPKEAGDAEVDDVLSVLDGWGLVLRGSDGSRPAMTIRDVAALIRRLASNATPQADQQGASALDDAMVERAREALTSCDWSPENLSRGFSVQDQFGEHTPCNVFMPDGAGLDFNHHAINGVDQARAEFVAAACNAMLDALLAGGGA